MDQKYFPLKWELTRLTSQFVSTVHKSHKYSGQITIRLFPFQETEFELQSMKKESAGTVELLDQFFRVEVSVDFHLLSYSLRR